MTAVSRLVLPRLYAILDADLLAANSIDLTRFAADLHSAGVRCMQYRDKTSSAPLFLDRARTLRQAIPTDAMLILNDRADIALLAAYDGVHLGQQDISLAGARRVLGQPIVGLSTHNEAQLHAAVLANPDYIAIGPVFNTASKRNPDPIVGLDGVRRARALTSLPLVAIGGITSANARSVIDAGADSVAVISALLPDVAHPSAGRLAEDFLTLLL